MTGVGSRQPNQLSIEIERLLLARNLRGLQPLGSSLEAGYFERAASHLHNAEGCILIGTGFPVNDTFETDGPLGAIALYRTLEHLGKSPVLVFGNPLYNQLSTQFNCLDLPLGDSLFCEHYAKTRIAELNPTCIVAIERPGRYPDGRYYNMRGEDISARCGQFDPFITHARCPTLAIGDGGNEIGMGKIRDALIQHGISPSATPCDELLLADVSNWAAYGLIAMLSLLHGSDLLVMLRHTEDLHALVGQGAVDGVSREPQPTEDSLAAHHGEQLITHLRTLCGFDPANKETP